MIAWNFQRIVGTCQFRVPWFGYPCGYSSLTNLIQSLKDYNQYIVWDDLSKAIRFEEQLPENFSMDDADCICRCVEHVDESVNAEISRLEDNNN